MQKSDILSIPPYLRQYFSEDSQFYYYEEYKKHICSHRQIDNRFICLKGFSSSTPLVNSVAFDSNSMGGGFYFKFCGLGVVIDPGIGFTTLMHKHNIFIDDIDVVIVSHAHIDHNCDVAALSSLLYDFNKNKQRRTKVYSEFLGYPAFKNHTIDWFLDDATMNNNADILDSNHVHSLSELVSQSQFLFKSETAALSVASFRTQHIRGSSDSYGLKLSFSTSEGNAIWGYTSDTAYFEDLNDFLNGCDVLLLNISDIYVSDVVHSKPKGSHLGFTGCEKLVAAIHPKLALVSEFCCTNGDYRFEIVRALRERCHIVNTLILPAEIGCKISILAESIECSLCQKNIPLSDIKVIHPQYEYEKIQYICPSCLL